MCYEKRTTVKATDSSIKLAISVRSEEQNQRCRSELGTVPRQRDPSREVGRNSMATEIIIAADRSKATNRAFTGPPTVSADSPIFPSQSGQPDFPELLPNRNGLIVPNGLGKWYGAIHSEVINAM
jgi:hypothetical protein